MKNILAIGGFIILLIIGIWSASQVVKFIPRLFSDTGVTKEVKLDDKDIVVKLTPSTTHSNSPVTISWIKSQTEGGLLSFAYECKEGFHFKMNSSPLPCNAPYTLGLEDTSIIVTPVTDDSLAKVDLAVTHTNESGVSIRDTQTLTITKDTGVVTTDVPTGLIEAPSVASPVAPTTPVVPVTRTISVPRTSNPYGLVDLSVSMIAVGKVNFYGILERSNYFRINDKAAAKFKVTNLGTKQSGPWFFSAVLPSQGGYAFTSQVQPSLMPGASTEVLVTFDQLISGTHSFNVRLDPVNYILESNENNNTTGQIINVLNY
ncbi:hypothetical protein COB52_03965 [Candidatus Kaiserbacteria bacterium]|nr:MAG: hypothetical protein COB52_03965 [Candidatus Kaiserbacteria bacterium]